MLHLVPACPYSAFVYSISEMHRFFQGLGSGSSVLPHGLCKRWKRVKWLHHLICSRRRLKWRCWHANTPVCTQRINSCKCICISYERYQWTVGIRYQVSGCTIFHSRIDKWAIWWGTPTPHRILSQDFLRLQATFVHKYMHTEADPQMHSVNTNRQTGHHTMLTKKTLSRHMQNVSRFTRCWVSLFPKGKQLNNSLRHAVCVIQTITNGQSSLLTLLRERHIYCKSNRSFLADITQ